MAKYYIAYKDLEDQAASFRDAQRALNGFESRLNSIADSMDGRDGSMAALKQQLKGCSRNLPAIANRVNAIAAAITEITEAYRNAEKKCYQDFEGESNSKDSSNASAETILDGAAMLAGLRNLQKKDRKLGKNDKIPGYEPMSYHIPKDISNAIGGAADWFSNEVDEAQKGAQRSLWLKVVDGFNKIGYCTTAVLLRDSLCDNPKKETFQTNSPTSKEIMSNPVFKKYLSKVLVKNKDKKSFTYSNKNLTFDSNCGSGDLFFAIHKANIKITGTKNSNGSWNLKITITDKFNFTEFKDPRKQKTLKSIIGWAGNDMAFISEASGAINPVPVNINIEYTNYKVK